MRYRALSASGDYQFGRGLSNFLIDTPAAVAQAVQTRLWLRVGEWFVDLSQGTPYATQVLGTHTQGTYDQALRQRILGTTDLTGIAAYSSSRDPNTRKLSVAATIDTAFGSTPATLTL